MYTKKRETTVHQAFVQGGWVQQKMHQVNFHCLAPVIPLAGSLTRMPGLMNRCGLPYSGMRTRLGQQGPRRRQSVLILVRNRQNVRKGTAL